MTESADRNLAEAVKLLHAASGMTYAQVMQSGKISKTHIHQIQSGKRTPSRAVVKSLDKVYRAGGLLTALAVEEDPVKRRRLFKIISALTAGGHEYFRLLDAIAQPRPGSVGNSDIKAVRQAIQFCTSLDLEYGGYAAIGPGRATLGWALPLLDANMSDEVRPLMFEGVAALADRVAWANYDAGNDHAARDLYGVALRVSRQGNDPNLVAHILLDASTRESHNGNHGEAADLLGVALDDRNLSPSVRANVGMTYARHVGNMGGSKMAMEEIQQSIEIGSRFDPGQVPEWSRRFLANPGHLTSVVSRSYLFAGQHDQAIEGFRAALGNLDSTRGRGRAYALCLLSIAYVRGGYMDMATETAQHAMTASQGVRSMRVVGHMRNLGRMFAAKGYREEAHRLKIACGQIDPSVTPGGDVA